MNESEKAAEAILKLDKEQRSLAIIVLFMAMGIAKGYHKKYPNIRTKPIRTLLRVIMDETIEGTRQKIKNRPDDTFK